MQAQAVMAKFRPKVEKLTLQKSTEQGSLITQRELAEKSGVPPTTLSRWYNKEFERMDADTAIKLMRYFNCTLDQLVDVVDEE